MEFIGLKDSCRSANLPFCVNLATAIEGIQLFTGLHGIYSCPQVSTSIGDVISDIVLAADAGSSDHT
jgi:hypothetical protein